MNLFTLSCAITLVIATGCATSPKDRALDSGSTAPCHVCEYNNDLACVCVKVKDNTPRAEYGGVTNYFCSEECRAAFLKKPEKYLRPAGTK